MTQIEFEPFEIESNIRILISELSAIRTNTPLKPTHQQKFDRWMICLNSILEQISTSEKEVIPLIENDLGYSFKNKNLFITAMLQPSLKNTFDEMKVHFGCLVKSGISLEILDGLVASPDTPKSLAWMGDTAIKYAILLRIWQPKITTEELHNRRKSLETNENFSRLCDRWKLFENRINLDPKILPLDKTLQETKGTLIEAIFGVIFIEEGIGRVQKAIDLIEIEKA